MLLVVTVCGQEPPIGCTGFPVLVFRGVGAAVDVQLKTGGTGRTVKVKVPNEPLLKGPRSLVQRWNVCPSVPVTARQSLRVSGFFFFALAPPFAGGSLYDRPSSLPLSVCPRRSSRDEGCPCESHASGAPAPNKGAIERTGRGGGFGAGASHLTLG